MAGAPVGNQNAVKGKPWTAAIERALAHRSRKDQHDALEALAETLLVKAGEGDMMALKELGDRIEGKPAQAITGPDGGAIQVEQSLKVSGIG